MQREAERLGIYLSVPFCRHKCSFCNFASGVYAGDAQERYVLLLCEEIHAAEHIAARTGCVLPRSVDTVYLGGGTPSLLTPAQLRQIFCALNSTFQIARDAEITLEAAPDQLAGDVLETALRCGVNRVSLGVQSFIDRECSAVGRTHTGESCLREFARLRASGVGSVGADLIAGLPYQTEASWAESLQRVADAELDHISVYMLEIDDESRLGREVLLGGQRFHAGHIVTEELVARLYEQACARLPQAGFAQYEISNFARPGFMSRHNLKYWERAPYMGLGLDAHSMLRTASGAAMRFANPDQLAEYTGANTSQEITHVSGREAFEETVFLGLRLCTGLHDGQLAAFPREWVSDFHGAAKELATSDLLERGHNLWRLTLRGQLLSSDVFGELLNQVPA